MDVRVAAWIALTLTACATATDSNETDPPKTQHDAAPAEAAVLPTDAGPPVSSLPECGAQRVVHLVAGNAGLAWFTQVWPVPAVIESFEPTDAFDDPSSALAAPGWTAEHPLYGRVIAERTVVMDGTGSHPMPTVFVSGFNETHTLWPDQTHAGFTDVVGVAATAQTATLHATNPIVVINGTTQLLTSTNVPQVYASSASDAAAAIGVSPVWSNVDGWFDTKSAPTNFLELARSLELGVEAFRTNAASTIVVGALRDDPHAAFSDLDAVRYRAGALASMLHDFYAELGAYWEPTCSHDGHALSLADNVVLIVTGDTTKDPFTRAGWPDGTPGNSNVVFVRSNGFLVPGWFGSLSRDRTKLGFDPSTGALSGAPTVSDDKNAATLAMLYAMTRGNAALVATVSPAPYQGALAATPP